MIASGKQRSPCCPKLTGTGTCLPFAIFGTSHTARRQISLLTTMISRSISMTWNRLTSSHRTGPAQISRIYSSVSVLGTIGICLCPWSAATRSARDIRRSRVFLKQYELFYVVADERDVLRLRTNYRSDPSGRCLRLPAGDDDRQHTTAICRVYESNRSNSAASRSSITR